MDVFLEILTSRQRSSTLEHELDVQVFPGELRWVALRQRLHLAPSDHQLIAVDRHRFRVTSVNRVEAKQIGEILDFDKVVDGYKVERWLVDYQL